MKRKTFSVLFTLTLAISLLMLASPSVLAALPLWTWEINAAAEPLEILINGSSDQEQVFHVGDELNLEGYVKAYAIIEGPGSLDVELWRQFSVVGPSGPAYTDDPIWDWVFGVGYLEVEGFDESISLTYELAAIGEHTIFLTSDVYVSGENDDVWFDDWDGADTQLTFTVVPNKTADLITDGGDNPTDVGDLKITYDAEEFNVEYIIDAPWEIVETHVYIGDVAPVKSNPGKFPYEAGDIVYDVELEESVYIAAYAEIRIQTGLDEFGNPVYVYEGVWAQTGTDYEIGKGANWATYFEYPIPVPES